MWKICLCILLILALSGICYGQSCPAGWRYNDGSCYLFSLDKYTFFESQVMCDLLNARILEVETESESNFIAQLLRNHGADVAWMGLVDFEVEDTYVWLSTGQEATNANWYGNEPNNNGNQDCVLIKSTTEWLDLDCKGHYFAICEKPALDAVVG